MSVYVASHTNAQTDDLNVIYPVPLTDAYITNPGIGWQHAPSIGDPLLPETVMYPQRSDISWLILNPDEGVYEWDVLDGFIVDAIAENKQISFRVYTMRGEEFGGHQLPEWVVDAGAVILENGEPDYSNCTYQNEWANFVEVLRERYDGHPHIAYIDISGYGDFNEWSWRDEQTEWDDKWADAYEDGEAEVSDIVTLDGQARRRLLDIYIGGAYSRHKCRTATGDIETFDYDYPGFQQTQLIMPYAGIRQSMQYMVTRRSDVGFRHDCLGREESDTDIIDKLGQELDMLWRTAPVIYEFCGSLEDNFIEPATNLLQATHGSLVHDNLDDEEYRNVEAIADLMRYVGYRYELGEAIFPRKTTTATGFNLQMVWRNVGYAPSYPRMGQDLQLVGYLVDAATNETIGEFVLDSAVANWMPAETIGEPAPDYPVNRNIQTANVPIGTYQVQVAIINQRTTQPINLAIEGQAANGRFTLGTIEIQ
jgi:hypothetical protein